MTRLGHQAGLHCLLMVLMSIKLAPQKAHAPPVQQRWVLWVVGGCWGLQNHRQQQGREEEQEVVASSLQ